MSRRAGLHRESVVQVAAEMADAEGLESVTLAALAARLGVRPPSLYNHIAGQEGLRRELALLGIRDLVGRMGRAAMGKSGDAAVEAIADAYRAYAHARPGVYAAALRAPSTEDGELVAESSALIDIVLAVLASYGLQGEDALHATRGLRSLVHGFVSLELAGGFGLPLNLDESFRRLVHAFAVGLCRESRCR